MGGKERAAEAGLAKGEMERDKRRKAEVEKEKKGKGREH